MKFKLAGEPKLNGKLITSNYSDVLRALDVVTDGPRRTSNIISRAAHIRTDRKPAGAPVH